MESPLGGRLFLDASIVLALACAVASFLFLRKFRQTFSSALPLPPASRGLPIIGETLHMLYSFRANKASEFVRARVFKYGAIFRSDIFFCPTVFVHGAEANRFVYSNEDTLFSICWPPRVINLVGENSLLAVHGPKHKRLRRLLTPCLYPEALQKIVGKVDKLTRQHLSEHWVGRDQVSMYPLVRFHSMNVSSIALAGVEDSKTRDQMAKLIYTMNKGIMTLPIYFPWTPFYKAHVARAKLSKILDDVLSKRKEEMEAAQSEDQLKDSFSTMLSAAKDEVGNPPTRNEVHDLCISLMFAGNDANSSTILAVCRDLNQNPECYEEVLKEQTAIAESMKMKNQDDLTWADIREMRYTWAVVQESWRMQPIVAGTMRLVLKDIEYGGYRIPQGWKIFNSISVSLLDSKYFPDPYKFDPSRFLQGNNHTPYAYTPFGGGPHVCPGVYFAKMVILVFLHRLVLKFKWTLVNPKEAFIVSPLPFPEQDLPVILQERK